MQIYFVYKKKNKNKVKIKLFVLLERTFLQSYFLLLIISQLIKLIKQKNCKLLVVLVFVTNELSYIINP